MSEDFIPQSYPLWVGYQETGCYPVACPVIGWTRDLDEPTDLLALIGLSDRAGPAAGALLLEYFPTYEMAQKWVDEHPATAEAAEQRRQDAKVTRLPTSPEED